MTDYHECELFVLKSDRLQGRKPLHQYLKARGYSPIDDFYVLDRKGRNPNWQSEQFLSVSAHRHGAEVNETEEDMDESGGVEWTELHCEYLLATLPLECVETALIEVDCLCNQFGLSLYWKQQQIGVSQLRLALHSIAKDLVQEFGEPGSKALRVLIWEEHNR